MRRHISTALALIALTLTGAGARELSLPAIPATLTETTERADYLLTHYWDAMDFADREAMADEEFMGQSLANFLSVFPLASPEGRRAGTGRMVQLASLGDDTEEQVMRLVEAYLLDTASPVHDEEAYTIFADAMLEAGWPGRESTLYLRDMATRCLPGTVAPDFSFETRTGTTTTLAEATAGSAAQTLLMFYNPTCGDCAHTIDALTADPHFDSLLRDGRLRAIAIYPDGDRHRWTASTKIPTTWTDGFTTADLADTLYAIPQLPTLYLLSPDGTILLKSPGLTALLHTLP